jgi:hypothetical protein
MTCPNCRQSGNHSDLCILNEAHWCLRGLPSFEGLVGNFLRDGDGTASAAVCEDIPVPEGLPSAAIAQTKSVNP